MTAVDASRIISGLYQGSRPPMGHLVAHAGFDVLVLSALEHQPPGGAYHDVIVIRVPLDDARPTSAERRAIVTAGRKVANHWRSGHRVLVTCMAGRNRSGVIMAVALRRLTGARPEEIVRHIRQRRPGALTNPWFVAALRSGDFD